MHFFLLAPGTYGLDVALAGFAPAHEKDIRIGAGSNIEWPVVLRPAITESVVVVAGPRIEARGSGYATSIGAEDLNAIPTPRAGPFDLLKSAPGISPTTPAGGTSFVSAQGGGVDQNIFLIDGTGFSAPSNGVARTEPGIDFIQELHIQAVGASAEFGNFQGAVVNVITRSGGNAFLYGASFYGQPAGLTSQPVRLSCAGCARPDSGYTRTKYHDVTTTLGGPVVRERIWFFLGYEHLRDYDSQPGTDPRYPRTFKQDKTFAKLTWRLASGWQLVQSAHYETWLNPEVPTITKPPEATQRLHASIPALTLGHLTHVSGNTALEVGVGQFAYSQVTSPGSGNSSIPNRVDLPSLWSGAPQQIGEVTTIRTTVKSTLTLYQRGLLGVDHEWKIGGQLDRGEHRSLLVIPTGERFVYSGGQLVQRISQPPSNAGGRFVTAAAFATDTITIGNRLTANIGVRFDQSRAISQALRALDGDGRETGLVIAGQGTLYTWNVVSPRLGITLKLDAAGRTMLRGSYGKYSQGVLTGEISPFHKGVTSTTTRNVNTGTSVTFDPTQNLKLPSSRLRAPHTDESSISLDREFGRTLVVSAMYVRKDGHDFIGWEDVDGVYTPRKVTAAGFTVPVYDFDLSSTHLFQLTNPDEYSLTYNGFVMAAERRRSHGWQASGSYTFSKAYGLQPSSGTTAAGAQVGTVGAPPVTFARPVTFGQDPNDLTNARGRLPNDRPHMFHAMTSVDVPRTGFVVAANLQYFSGKPWAATALISVNQNSQQRILLEPRGSRRLSSQTLLDVRVSRTIRFRRIGRIELIMDVLNALNDAAEEGLATDVLVSTSPVLALTSPFPQPNVFMTPRRAMFSVKFSLGR